MKIKSIDEYNIKILSGITPHEDEIDEESLINEIRHPSFDVSSGIDALAKRYKILVPDYVIRAVLCDYIWLAGEMKAGSISDTFAIEGLYECLCDHMDVVSPPSFGDSAGYVRYFRELFHFRASAFGIKFVE